MLKRLIAFRNTKYYNTAPFQPTIRLTDTLALIDTPEKWIDIKKQAFNGSGDVTILLDKDNTYTETFKNKVYWVSNSISINARKGAKFEGVPVIPIQNRKPNSGPEVVKYLNLSKEDKVLVIGDRIMTDVLLANLNGWKSVHVVKIIDASRDGVAVSFQRWFENRFLYD